MAKEKDVKYEQIVMDGLPERPPRGSQIEESLSAIEADPNLVGKAVCIAQYAQPTAATAAANILRKRHGKPGAYGWEFATRKIRVDNEDKDRTGLFVVFNPSRIVPGDADAFEVEKSQREAEAKAKRDAKKAEKNGSAKSKTKASANA